MTLSDQRRPIMTDGGNVRGKLRSQRRVVPAQSNSEASAENNSSSGNYSCDICVTGAFNWGQIKMQCLQMLWMLGIRVEQAGGM